MNLSGPAPVFNYPMGKENNSPSKKFSNTSFNRNIESFKDSVGNYINSSVTNFQERNCNCLKFCFNLLSGIIVA